MDKLDEKVWWKYVNTGLLAFRKHTGDGILGVRRNTALDRTGRPVRSDAVNHNPNSNLNLILTLILTVLCGVRRTKLWSISNSDECIRIITSAKEVMFLSVFVCLFVCLSVCLLAR